MLLPLDPRLLISGMTDRLKNLSPTPTLKFFLTSPFLIFLMLKQVQHRPQFLEGQLNPFCNDIDKQWRIKVLLYNLLIVNESISERIYAFTTEGRNLLKPVKIKLDNLVIVIILMLNYLTLR